MDNHVGPRSVPSCEMEIRTSNGLISMEDMKFTHLYGNANNNGNSWFWAKLDALHHHNMMLQDQDTYTDETDWEAEIDRALLDLESAETNPVILEKTPSIVEQPDLGNAFGGRDYSSLMMTDGRGNWRKKEGGGSRRGLRASVHHDYKKKRVNRRYTPVLGGRGAFRRWLIWSSACRNPC